MPSSSDDDDIDFESLQFLHESDVGLKRFQGRYLDAFTISDTTKSRWMSLDDHISHNAFGLENICANQSLEADVSRAHQQIGPFRRSRLKGKNKI